MRVFWILSILIAGLPGCTSSKSAHDDSTLNGRGEASSSQTQRPYADFSDVNAGWVVTKNGDLMLTNDGGVNWTRVSGDIVGKFDLISFIDESIGWAISQFGILWKTEDGGRTWHEGYIADDMNRPPFPAPEAMEFTDKLHGWIVLPFYVLRTNDGGASWQPVDPTTKSIYHFYCIFTIDSKHVWVGGDGYIYHTKDGGSNWEEIKITGPETEFIDIAFVSEDIGWARAIHGELYRTTDGGHSWNSLTYSRYGKNYEANSMQFLNATDGWAVGWDSDVEINHEQHGIVLRTMNSGMSWKEVSLDGNKSSFEVIRFVDQQNGWLLSRDKLYKSKDAGKTWNVVLTLL
jgi:photosystem II stability/assembly factor-like uncharacterized protein